MTGTSTSGHFAEFSNHLYTWRRPGLTLIDLALPDLAIFSDAPFAPEMVTIPPGRFLMGSSVDDDSGHEGGTEVARADTALIDVAQLIVPTLYDHGVIEWTRKQSGETGPALVFLPAGNHTVAEIIMAGADRRHTRLSCLVLSVQVL